MAHATRFLRGFGLVSFLFLVWVGSRRQRAPHVVAARRAVVLRARLAFGRREGGLGGPSWPPGTRLVFVVAGQAGGPFTGRSRQHVAHPLGKSSLPHPTTIGLDINIKCTLNFEN